MEIGCIFAMINVVWPTVYKKLQSFNVKRLLPSHPTNSRWTKIKRKLILSRVACASQGDSHDPKGSAAQFGQSEAFAPQISAKLPFRVGSAAVH